jgi:formylglycine-generating enzyme required for sulfatase activity
MKHLALAVFLVTVLSGSVAVAYSAVRENSSPENPNPQFLVWIPPGTFTMESPASEKDRHDWEGPQTVVAITKGFWMSKYETTQAEYQSVMGSNPSHFTGDLNRPVEQVSWKDATNYCGKLTARERAAGRLPAGFEYRLPTEAEWEYACRAGTETEFYWGDDAGVSNDYAWHCLDAAHCSTQPVGQLTPNAWGLYDMSGNVMEWCHDRYDPAYYTTDAIVNPQGPEPPATGYVSRVRRGGATADLHDIAFCRSAMRYHNIQGFSQADTGFRLVRESND